jgi:hypothetical protein
VLGACVPITRTVVHGGAWLCVVGPDSVLGACVHVRTHGCARGVCDYVWSDQIVCLVRVCTYVCLCTGGVWLCVVEPDNVHEQRLYRKRARVMTWMEQGQRGRHYPRVINNGFKRHTLEPRKGATTPPHPLRFRMKRECSMSALAPLAGLRETPDTPAPTQSRPFEASLCQRDTYRSMSVSAPRGGIMDTGLLHPSLPVAPSPITRQIDHQHGIRGTSMPETTGCGLEVWRCPEIAPQEPCLLMMLAPVD